MSKNRFLVFILSVSLLANCIFLYNKIRVGNSFKEKELALIKMYGEKVADELSTERLKINPFEQLTDLKGTPIILNSLIEDSEKLILVVSDNSCGSCTEISLKTMQKNASLNLVKDILVLGLFEKKREFFLLSKQYPFKFLLLSETSSLKETANKGPVFITLDKSSKINSAFFPDSRYPFLLESYMYQVLKYINL